VVAGVTWLGAPRRRGCGRRRREGLLAVGRSRRRTGTRRRCGLQLRGRLLLDLGHGAVVLVEHLLLEVELLEEHRLLRRELHARGGDLRGKLGELLIEQRLLLLELLLELLLLLGQRRGALRRRRICRSRLLAPGLPAGDLADLLRSGLVLARRGQRCRRGL